MSVLKGLSKKIKIALAFIKFSLIIPEVWSPREHYSTVYIYIYVVIDFKKVFKWTFDDFW